MQLCKRTRLAWVARTAASLAVCFSLLAPASHAQGGKELVFLTWSEYIDPALVERFEQLRGVKIRFEYFDSDDGRNAILADADGRGFDLTIVSGEALPSYVKRQWITDITPADVPNRHHINARWFDAYPESARFGLPYMWGTIGIAYREDLVPAPITSWQGLLAPPEQMKGRVAMTRSGRDLVGLALMSLGYSGNSSDRAELKAAEQVLLAQKPYVRTYDYVSLEPESALVSGDIWATFAYNGDALMLMEHHPSIRFTMPAGRRLMWIDYLAVMQSSLNKELAFAFLDFLNEPANAAQLAEYLWGATPNDAALPFTSEEYRNNGTIFPPGDVLEKAEFVQSLPPRAQKTVNGIRARVLR